MSSQRRYRSATGCSQEFLESPRRSASQWPRASLIAATLFALAAPFASSAASAHCISVGVDIDEHLLVDPQRDEDYAGGFALKFAGSSESCGRRSLAPVLTRIDHDFGLGGAASAGNRRASHAFGGGLLVFTPRNLAARSTVPGDRPYASLLYLSSGRRTVSADDSVAVDSTLTVGVLGLALGQNLQRALHHITSSVQPMGWRHQISSGGEPTARFGLARQSLLFEHVGVDQQGYDVKWSALANAGMISDAGLAINIRAGRIASPWWAYTPEQNAYTDDFLPPPPRLAAGRGVEIFAMAGARVRMRAYDVFLEGQFRHSDLRYSGAALRPILADAWVGFEVRVAQAFDLSYLVRAQTPEMRSGRGARTLLWASIEIEHPCSC